MQAMSEHVTCILCGSGAPEPLFSKPSACGEPFTLVRCRRCGMRFVSPRPEETEIGRYYEGSYFTTRTDRGYNNYFSPDVRKEIERVIALNLGDLGFERFESDLGPGRRALDIGCAAGYFVNYLASRNWDAQGIDIAPECVRFASESLGLNVTHGNYLERHYQSKFNLITLWATIEHLHHPQRVLEKARDDLADGGRLYLSTCRAGDINFMQLFGSDWRYYNFPEHLYFFSYPALKNLLRRCGFEVTHYRTYGSGAGKPGSILRKVADFSAKKFYMGDMMLLSARAR